MNTPVRVCAHYLRRGRDRATTVLMTISLALPFALLLTVVGGANMFVNRYYHPRNDFMSERFYLFCAAVAVTLTIIPIFSASATAARLGLLRRTQHLGVMRLLGLSPRQVKQASLVDTLLVAGVGLAAGFALYLLTMPLWQFAKFQDTYISWQEMWLGVELALLCLALTTVIVTVSAWLALRPLDIGVLGVLRRSEAAKVSKKSLLVLVGILLIWFWPAQMMLRLSVALGIGVGVAILALVLLMIHFIGVVTIALGGRLMAAFSASPAALVAARRIIDNPRTQWRSFGALALVAFIVATTVPTISAISSYQETDYDLVISHDLILGMLIVFSFTFLLAAISTLSNQSARALDSAAQLRALIHLGASPAFLDRARRWEVSFPMLITVGTAFILGLVFSLPLSMQVLRLSSIFAALGILVLGVALVLLAGEGSRWWQRQALGA
ncbi:MAG: hypothetical protein Q4P06_03305 [Actinomycetaceae bacterium]|nr:hypothetical protein [Actinomycetaceae bacterium]